MEWNGGPWWNGDHGSCDYKSEREYNNWNAPIGVDICNDCLKKNFLKQVVIQVDILNIKITWDLCRSSLITKLMHELLNKYKLNEWEICILQCLNNDILLLVYFFFEYVIPTHRKKIKC